MEPLEHWILAVEDSEEGFGLPTSKSSKGPNTKAECYKYSQRESHGQL